MGFGTEFLKGARDLDVQKGSRLESTDLSNIGDRNFLRSNLNQDSYAVNTKKKRPFGLNNVKANMGKYETDKSKGKGKLKKKKKKKKKAKKKTPKAKASELEVVVYEEEQRPKAQEKDNTSYENGGYTPFVDPEAEENSEYDTWAKLLLVRPNRTETLNFIREYQSGKIKVETFFRLVNEMYANEISEFRSLAVLAAGSVPSLQSYNFLITAYRDDANPSVRSEANSELRDYQSLQFLWVPRNVISALQSQELTSVQIAANAIDKASASYLTPRARSEASEAPAISNEYKNYFLSMIPVLELAIERYKESPEVVSSLSSALSRIQQLEVVAFNEEF
jgi:hypothetical protein